MPAWALVLTLVLSVVSGLAGAAYLFSELIWKPLHRRSQPPPHKPLDQRALEVYKMAEQLALEMDRAKQYLAPILQQRQASEDATRECQDATDRTADEGQEHSQGC